MSGEPCTTCGFVNPTAWRACARCGKALSSPVRRTGVAPLTAGVESTVVEPAATDLASDPALEDALELPSDALEEVVDEPGEAHDDGEPPLIGQTEAAEAIQTGIERAFTVGAPTLVVLEGGRGSGKTRLLVHASEIAARVSDQVRVLYASCRDGDGSYAPFNRLLLERFGVTPSSSPSAVRGQMSTKVSQALGTADVISVAETTHLLGHVAGIPFPDSPFLTPLIGKPEELHRRTVGAVAKILEAEAQSQPIALLLDNMHHAEREAWDVVAKLCEVSAHLAIVVAGKPPTAERASGLAPAGGVAVGPIAPLSEQDVASMLHVLLPALHEAPEALVFAVAHRSGGVPSAVRELVLALWEAGLFAATPGGLEVDLPRLESGDGLPVSMEDAIKGRVERLDPLERATLERAAVVGEVFWDGALLAQMRSERGAPGTGDPLTIWPDDDDLGALTAALHRLVDKGFVEEVANSDLPGTRELRFHHDATRDRVYAEIPSELLVLRHGAVARFLAVVAEVRREGVAGLIAPHLEKAGQKVRAGRAYLEAAAYEHGRLRTRTALRLVEKALPLIPNDDVVRRIEALHQHGSLLTTLGRYDEAIEAFTGMLQLAWIIGARGKGGAALNRIARAHRQRGEDEQARALLLRALDLFRTAADLRGVAATLDDLAQIELLHGTVEEAARAATEALEIRRAHGDQRGEALSLNTLGQIALRRGDLDAADALFGASLDIRRAIGDREGLLQSYNAAGIVAFERGDRASAVASWEAALEQAREVADRRSECFLLNNVGESLLNDGKLDRAGEFLMRARDLAQDLGDRRGAAEVERNLGVLALRRGDDDAAEVVARALELAKEYGSPEAIALAHRAMGMLRARTLFDAAGQVDRRAEESFLASIDMFQDMGNEKEAARSLAELGFHLVERGDVDTARERLREARAIMRRVGLGEVDRVDRTLADLG